MDVLKEAIDAAKKNNILTIAVASTTGTTAKTLFELVKNEKLRTIVVTHDEGRPASERRFSEDIRKLLLANTITVYTHNPRLLFLQKVINGILRKFGLSAWYTHLQKVKERYGTGVKVCHIILKMLIEGKVLRDSRVVAIAGAKSGADSAAIFAIHEHNKWPILEEVIVNSYK